jgi:large subunit ribosomal protein L21
MAAGGECVVIGGVSLYEKNLGEAKWEARAWTGEPNQSRAARQARTSKTSGLPARFHSPRRKQDTAIASGSVHIIYQTNTMASIISRTLRRAVLDSRGQLPPTFLLPWAANLSTIPNATESSNIPPPETASPLAQKPAILGQKLHNGPKREKPQNRISKPIARAPALPEPAAVAAESRGPMEISPEVREMLPLLRAQGPHYISAHIYAQPYLLTQGDTVRLPFYMKGVEPGDVIRLDRATHLGSRDFTLKAAGQGPKLKSPTMQTIEVLDPTTGNLASHSRVMPEGSLASAPNAVSAPHFIPHIAKGKYPYLDDRLYVCRAVVMGVESEPLRILQKTKRRQRKVKNIKSKHRFTILKIKELRLRTEDELSTGLLN